MEQLLYWNERMNLTAIKEPEQVAVKHFLDSALLLRYAGGCFEGSARVIDVGTGAGFPGMVLKILCPQIHLTLLDSLNKRLTFLGNLSEILGLETERIHARAEEAGRSKELRGGFDIALARAVAPLNLLSEYCMPFVKEGGTFISMKGPGAGQELASAKSAIGQLGGKAEEPFEYELPGGDKRSLILVKRVKPLSDIYPRPAAKIKKKPL